MLVRKEAHQEGAQNWELERIATTDRILMKMALAEARTFESIPLKVTLNEYIELSKYYSTPKSHDSINGILDQLFTKLKEGGKIKSGRPHRMMSWKGAPTSWPWCALGQERGTRRGRHPRL